MMTAEQLKNSILQLAMQGKLVEQRSSEGTGEELYKEIQAERKRFVKEGKIKKQKPLQGINEDDIPFDIPAHWIWTQIGDVTFMEAGGTPARTKSEYWNGNIPWVKIGDMHGKYTSVTEESITQKGLECSTAKVLTKGTVLYSIFASIGTVSILTIDAATNQAIVGISHTNAIDNEYLYYVLMGLKSVVIQKQHGMAQMNINQTILKEAPFPLPPLAEQKRIVAKIEELMPFVEQYAAASTKLNTLNASFPEMMKKSILQEAVQGKFVPQDPNDEPASLLLKKIAEEKKRLIKEGKIKKQKPLPEITEDEIPFDIPESWEWIRLSDISKQITDGEHSTPKRVSDFCGFYLLSARNVRDGEIKLDDVDYVDNSEFERISSRCNPVKGDILISCSGSVGRCAVVNDDNKYVMVRSAAMASPIMCDSNYLMYAIQSDCVQRQINALKKQTAQANLFLGAISVLKLPLPPYNEQKRIVSKLNQVLSHTEKAFNTLSFE